jgi:hypothetical protein
MSLGVERVVASCRDLRPDEVTPPNRSLSSEWAGACPKKFCMRSAMTSPFSTKVKCPASASASSVAARYSLLTIEHALVMGMPSAEGTFCAADGGLNHRQRRTLDVVLVVSQRLLTLDTAT